jgi:hypothetical protein
MDASRQQGSVGALTDIAAAKLFAAPAQIEGLKREAGELPEATIDMLEASPDEAAHTLLLKLEGLGLLRAER